MDSKFTKYNICEALWLVTILEDMLMLVSSKIYECKRNLELQASTHFNIFSIRFSNFHSFIAIFCKSVTCKNKWHFYKNIIKVFSTTEAAWQYEINPYNCNALILNS